MKKLLSPVMIFAMIIVSISCSSVEITPHPAVITDSNMCAAACDNLKALGCEEGQPIDFDVKCKQSSDCLAGQYCEAFVCHATCEQFCHDTQDAGVFLDPTCVSQIVNCKQVNGCPATVKK